MIITTFLLCCSFAFPRVLHYVSNQQWPPPPSPCVPTGVVIAAAASNVDDSNAGVPPEEEKEETRLINILQRRRRGSSSSPLFRRRNRRRDHYILLVCTFSLIWCSTEICIPLNIFCRECFGFTCDSPADSARRELHFHVWVEGSTTILRNPPHRRNF